MSSSTTDVSAGGLPGLSAVVASSNGGDLLARCLAALAAQPEAGSVEIVVVRDRERFDDVDRAALDRRHPGLRWIEAPRGATVPRLRGLGIAAARAERIALLEDDCLVDAGWAGAALARRGETAAVGGAVEPGPYRRALDWAVYFCEYGRFMLPVPAVDGAPMPGNNVVYERRFLEALAPAERDEFREVFVHDAWRRAGVATCVDGALVVRNVSRWSFRHVTSVPFHHGRAYAARRFGDLGLLPRSAVALLALALPALKCARVVAGTLRRRRFAGRLLQAAPFILAFTVSWSIGEILGCLVGPGDSPARWR